MHPRLSRIALLATALLVALPSFALANNTPVEGTTSKSYPEDYESFSTTGVNPSSPWGTYTTSGTGTYLVATGGACTGTRCMAVADTVTATFSVDFNNDGLGVNLCTAGQSVTFSFALSAGITLNQVWHVRIATAGPSVLANPANSIDIALTGSLAATEAATIVLNSNTGTQTPVSLGSYTAPGVVGVTLDTMNCVGSTPSVHYSVLGGGLSSSGTFTSSSLVSGDFDSIQVASSSTALPSNTVDLDNINWQGAPLPAPTVSGINPNQGISSGGTPVTVTGTGYKTGATVSLGGSPLTGVTVVSGTSITGTTSGHTAGQVNVIVTNPDSQTATLVNGFTYNPTPTPFVNALTPSSGIVEGGTLVNVTGGNFQAGFSATFGGTSAISPTFVSATLVRVTTPPHAAGSVDFVLTNPDTQTTAPTTYVYTGSGGGGGGGTVIQNPSAFANSGYASDIDVNGEVIAIVHRNSGNALVFTYSIDGGANWVDRAVGVTVAYPFARVFAFGPTTFGISYFSGTLRPTFLRSVDGGLNWVSVTLPELTCGPFAETCQTGLGSYDILESGGAVYAVYGEGGAGGCSLAATCYSYAMVKSIDEGATWTRTATLAQCNTTCANPRVPFQFGLSLTSPTAGLVFQTASGVMTKYTFSASGATISSAAFNDPLTPLTNFGYAIRASPDGAAIGFKTSTGQAYLGLQQPGGQFFFYSYGPTGNLATFVDVYNTPAAGTGAISVESGGPWFKVYITTNQGASFTVTAPVATTTTTDTDPSVFAKCNNAYLAYRDPSTNRLAFATLVNTAPCAAEPSQQANCIFCSAAGNDNFGYEYVEQVIGVGDQRYRFKGNTEDFAYLGKSWTGGSKIVSSYFAIQAQTDSESSVFRSNFGTLGTTPSGTTKGNGKSTGHFAEHVEVQFLETGDEWNVRIYHVSASNSVTTRTQLGTAVLEGNPNQMEFYNFTVNSVLGKVFVTKTELFGDHPGQQIPLFPGGVTLPAYWANDAFLDHWFVGYGTGVAQAAGEIFGFPAANAHLATTFLSDGGRWPLSTCIYTFDTAVVSTANGDSGRTAPTSDGTTLSELTGAGVGTTGNTTAGDDLFGPGAGSFFLPANAVLPDGFTRSTFSFLLGILFMFFLAAGTYFTLGKNAIAGAIGGGAGFMGAFAFGLFPLWAVLLVALACAAILVLRFKGGGG